MAPDDGAPTAPATASAVSVGRPVMRGPATGGADGVSRVLTGPRADLAHTMAVCGLGEVGSVPRGTVARPP